MSKKEKYIVFCGLDCYECSAYKATRINDMNRLAEIAELWSDDKVKFTSYEVICDGCTSERLSKECSLCPIRACCLEKNLENCAYCVYYPCEKLEKHWESWTEEDQTVAKATLNKITEKYSRAHTNI